MRVERAAPPIGIGIVVAAALATCLAFVQVEPTPAELLEKGPFQLRALKPSERPWMPDRDRHTGR